LHTWPHEPLPLLDLLIGCRSTVPDVIAGNRDLTRGVTRRKL
jgi:hypothetical protein